MPRRRTGKLGEAVAFAEGIGPWSSFQKTKSCPISCPAITTIQTTFCWIRGTRSGRRGTCQYPSVNNTRYSLPQKPLALPRLCYPKRGDRVESSTPYSQGLLSGNTQQWNISTLYRAWWRLLGGLSRGELLPPSATLTVEGKRFQVLRVLLDRPLRKSSTYNAEYIQRFEGALTR